MENRFQMGVEEITEGLNSGESKGKKDKREVKPQFSNEPTSKGESKRVSEVAKKRISEALDKRAESTISINREGKEWVTVVEVLEEEYIPGMDLKSMNDIIGIYEVKLDSRDELIGWNKLRSRKRGDFSK